MRKRVGGEAGLGPVGRGTEKDIAALATVLVTSEDPARPIDYAFDARRGPGGTRWVAAAPGDQVVNLLFDAPQTVRRVVLEVEEPDVSRTPRRSNWRRLRTAA